MQFKQKKSLATQPVLKNIFDYKSHNTTNHSYRL